MPKFRFMTIFLLLITGVGVAMAALSVPSAIDQPGTQPGEVKNLESPDKCDNCHGGYDPAVEPAFNWRASMMANAGRDPIFWATLAITEQDFDGAGDLCIRCHSTAGWLAGRSTPTDGSGLAAGDADGVECDFCHKMTNPDNSEHIGIMNAPFIANNGTDGFYGSGMASVWDGTQKLGPYANAPSTHKSVGSLFHRSVDFCGTCHDVSNPGVGNLSHNFGAQAALLSTETIIADGSIDENPKDYNDKAAFRNLPAQYGIVERTFSEYKSSRVPHTLVRDYPGLPTDLQAGALESAYIAALAAGTGGNYEDNTDRYFSCQTCHMRPVSGFGCNKEPIFRNDLPLHAMTGGNYWMPDAILYLDGQDKLRLGGGLDNDQISALSLAKSRAIEQLDLAATVTVEGDAVKVVNLTGHKLISGYPEGRRMWLNIKWYNGLGELIREDGAYGPLYDGSGNPVMDPLNGTVQVESIHNLHDPNTRIYEAHYGLTQPWAKQLIGINAAYGDIVLSYNRITGTPDYHLGDLAAASTPDTHHESFHFVLNNMVIKDNRIPPYGMNYETARLKNALPVPADQYNGGPGRDYDYFDYLEFNVPMGATHATIDLLYQPTSYEYQLFLLKANQMTNAFLASEGEYMFEAWLQTGMASPHVMATTTWTKTLAVCAGDAEPDGDIDGRDLAVLLSIGGLPLDRFAADYGRTDCPLW